MCHSCFKTKVSDKQKSQGEKHKKQRGLLNIELFVKVKDVLSSRYGVIYPEANYPVILVNKDGMRAATKRHRCV